MTEHKYGPKGHIVDAFVEHVEGMPETDLQQLHAAQDALVHAVRAAGGAEWYELDAWYATPHGVGDAEWQVTWQALGFAPWIAWHAVWEILTADLMRERGKPFYFLPMFGFADEQAVLAALQPKEETKMTNEELDSARADEARNIIKQTENQVVAVIAARLAREGWTPPQAVDPDAHLALHLSNEWLCNDDPNPEQMILRAIKRGRELGRAEPKEKTK